MWFLFVKHDFILHYNLWSHDHHTFMCVLKKMSLLLLL